MEKRRKMLARCLCVMLLLMGAVAPANAQTTVTWWTWSTEATEAFQKIADEFEKQNPDIKIDLQFIANKDYWTKLPVAIASGSGPDLYQMTRPSFELYAASGQTMDLSSYIADSKALQANVAEMDPTLVESYQFDDKQMAIPFSVESAAIAYNKTLFEAAGLPDLKTIEDTWTWEDLRELAKKLTVKSANGETSQYGFLVPADRMPQWELIWSHGLEMFNETKDACVIDDPGIVEAAQILVDMYLDGVSPSTEATATMSADDMFMSGKIAMVTAGSWKVPTYNNITTFEWDVAELPFDAATGVRRASSNVLGFVVNPKSKAVEATIQFLGFASSTYGQGILADTHTYIPANVTVRDSFFQGNKPANLLAYQRALDYVHPNTLTQYIPYQQFLSEFNNAFRDAYTGQKTLQEAMTEHCAVINQIMRENKENFE